MDTGSSMSLKIIAHASSRHSAKYHVQVRGRVYEVRLEDLPGEACTVRIDGLEEGSGLYRLIKRVVLKDWLG
jgi:hypothetical protein